MNDAADPTVLLGLALDAAREAGALVHAMRAEGVDVAGTKTSAVDVVTRADQASEELIRTRLLAARPDDGFLGEEGHDSPGTTGVRWIVDPIDGTVNYLYGIPAYAVSIGVEVDGQVVAGVVLNPALGEEYAARRGAGATLNGSPIHVRDAVPLERALVCTGFSYEADVRADQGAAVTRMLPLVRDIRRAGSCALDLCGVALGRADAYLEEGTHAWDHAAGGLVAHEAGATFRVTTGAHGRELVLCAPGALFPAFERLVGECGF